MSNSDQNDLASWNESKGGSIADNPSSSLSCSSEPSGGEQRSPEKIFKAWSSVLDNLRLQISAPIFDAYFNALSVLPGSALPETTSGDSSFNKQEICIHAPSTLVRNHLESTFSCQLRKLFAQELGNENFTLVFSAQQSFATAAPKAPIVIIKRPTLSEDGTGQSGITVARGASDFSPNINPKYTFSNFVVGNSNQFCHAASLQVAEKPGVSYNPLFIYGGVGLGKTHLLHAIGNKILDANPAARVLYMSSEAFTNELIQALRNSKMDEFKNKMRSIEVLLIDDIQFMVGKERTQEEFFHTFNALYGAKHQIVITSDKIPSDIPQIEERLYTRFSWGLIADIQSPDFETRVAILKRKATNEQFALPEDVAHLIAEKVSSNVRELEGALTRLHAISSLQGLGISKEVAINALKHLFQPKKVNLSVDDIKKAVASHFNLKVSDIISKRRTKNLSFPRHIAMYLCRKHTTCSYPEIGAHFGNRDHSSVIHAASVVTTKIKNDAQVRLQVSEIEKHLLSA